MTELTYSSSLQRVLDGLTKEAAVDAVVDLSESDDDRTVVEISSAIPTPADDLEKVDGRPPMTSRVTAKNALQHPDTHPLILDLLLLKKYGPEWLEWEPETLLLRIQHDFGRQISELNMHKVQAAKTLHLVDTFWTDWHIFCWVCMALNSVPPDFSVMQVPTVGQAMRAVDIANRVRQDIPFSSELNDYLEQVHMYDGVFVPIEPLEFVSMDDVEEYPVDCGEIKLLWPAVRASKKPPSAETVTAEQLRRMLALREDLEDARAQLHAQLPLLMLAD